MIQLTCSHFFLIDEEGNGEVGKYRVDADFMRDKITELEAKVVKANKERDTLAKERDALAASLSTSKAETDEERKQKEDLLEVNATYGHQITVLIQKVQELDEKIKSASSQNTAPATVSSHGFFASRAASSNDDQVQHQPK